MIRWIGSLFGLEPVKLPIEQQSKAAQTYSHSIPTIQVPAGTHWACHNHQHSMLASLFDTFGNLD
jgi:hypothetical protein